MKTKNLEFDGKTYICRVVKSIDGEDLIIGSTRLLDALRPHLSDTENDGFACKEAARIDEEVFFYTDDNDLRLPDNELVEVLKESNPEWFD